MTSYPAFSHRVNVVNEAASGISVVFGPDRGTSREKFDGGILVRNARNCEIFDNCFLGNEQR